MALTKVKVDPIYGWGWPVPGRPADYVPQPFEMQMAGAEADEWTGTVSTPGHEFEGARVALSPRHTEWDGFVNIAVHPSGDDDVVITGFASVPLSLKAH
jgi:hypothetical protein